MRIDARAVYKTYSLHTFDIFNIIDINTKIIKSATFNYVESILQIFMLLKYLY